MNGTNGHASEPLISGLAHVNLTIPRGTLDQAFDFYGNTLGLISGKLEATIIIDGKHGLMI
jgi:4-hydroxyphenylpyruvate dioxygenase-like putative hemolysin